MKLALRTMQILCAAALTTGSALADPAKQPTLPERLARLGYIEGADVDRIQRYSLEGWQKVDGTHFIMDAGPSRYYLITLLFSCSGIDFAQNIGFSTTPPGDLTRLDEIIVREPGTRQRCPIKAINALDKLKKDAPKP